LVDPPPLLFLKGKPEILLRPAVAVVGSRKATEAGRRTGEALGRVLGRAGVPVVSGMALGIDGTAHRGALAAGGDTVAVLGSGLDLPYPRAHGGLFREIGKKGLLVSEFLPSERALPHHFPKRNRILAALSRAVVVVEAGRKSGALITVDHALDLGRDIFAFPGSIENPRAAGTNALLRDGARVLTSPEAILLEIPELVEEARGLSARGEGGSDGSPSVPRELRSLWASLSKEPLSLDHLARRAGLAPERALAGLSSLELLGEARRCPGMRFSRG
jgi:DNA processing protein